MTSRWKHIELLVLDFDGVMTDGYVYVDQNGKEHVRCSRKDGLGIERLKESGIEVVVISREKNQVVQARCTKLGIECFQGVGAKIELFKQLLEKKKLTADRVCYVGDDIIDCECIAYAGIGVAVTDAEKDVLKRGL